MGCLSGSGWAPWSQSPGAVKRGRGLPAPVSPHVESPRVAGRGGYRQRTKRTAASAIQSPLFVVHIIRGARSSAASRKRAAASIFVIRPGEKGANPRTGQEKPLRLSRLEWAGGVECYRPTAVVVRHDSTQMCAATRGKEKADTPCLSWCGAAPHVLWPLPWASISCGSNMMMTAVCTMRALCWSGVTHLRRLRKQPPGRRGTKV